VIDLYIADGSEPLWVTSIWLALKFLVVWLALRLTLLRAFLAVVAMVIASTVVLMAWEMSCRRRCRCWPYSYCASLLLSVVTALSSDIDRASSAYIVPVGSTRADVVRAAGGPSLERSVGSQDFAC
jgi:hypothetical protein